MGNNASKQGDKEKDREKDAPPLSPVSTTNSAGSSFTASRKEPRTGSIRRPHRDDTSASSSVKSNTGPSLPISTNAVAPGAPDQSKPDKMGSEQSKISKDEKDKSKSKSKTTPVRVPRGVDPHRQRGPDSQFEPSGPPPDPNYIPHSNLNHPPRLPLPIHDEAHHPGSPIIRGQDDISSALHHSDVEGPLPRQASNISSTTADDDDLGDQLLQQQDHVDGYVPTPVIWRHGGEKIYVTGTFASWNTKIRMHKE